ncbi:undecaprenyl-phosphate glucose phosphotransferase [Thioalkalivibrio paradoxus]|uniref:UDP-phosphate galactose phosphotransferase n=1 Tax=Thioalkalivibrio paradoxus ARh 1 TaxID=713585 RepID=W0DIV7_9GAMM|nr:undecaprenyl-phosphate glucose phosphotransferase [Thioalkalivibrio paradoxus]AHE98544.1 UDP-phosphate galactose phosphotransferase [Thioalkalivibrio paradoxus ARh 1]
MRAQGRVPLPREREELIRVMVRVGDFSMVLLAGIIAYALRFGTVVLPDYYILGLAVAVLLTALLFPTQGLYREWQGRFSWAQLAGLTVAWATVLLVLVLAAVATKTTELYSRLWVSYTAVLGWTFLVMFRLALGMLQSWLGTRGWSRRRVLILGAGVLGREVAGRVRDTGWSGFEVVGFLDDNPGLQRQRPLGIPVLGSLDTVANAIERERIDEVWLALPLRAEIRLKEVESRLRNTTVALRFIPDIYGFRLLHHAIGEVAGVPMLNLSDTPMRGINRLVKALEDRLLAVLILLLVWPLMLAIAVAVRMETPGPAIFRQLRHGWDGRPIEVWKFRSMCVDAEPADATGYRQATRNDPRVTRVGAWLRRTSLDELPQFINVLQGRMSIVGPRPHPIRMNALYRDRVDSYMRRHKVKPGITGWAQVNGFRGETDTLEKITRRVEHDLYYIENWSLWLDLRILWLTLVRGFVDANAY